MLTFIFFYLKEKNRYSPLAPIIGISEPVLGSA